MYTGQSLIRLLLQLCTAVLSNCIIMLIMKMQTSIRIRICAVPCVQLAIVYIQGICTSMGSGVCYVLIC